MSGPSANALEHPVKLVFVLGAPRSGTTWVSSILGEHPEIAACVTETYVFPRFLGPLLSNWDESTRGRVGLHRDLDADRFVAACRGFGLSLLEPIWARSPGARALVEKTPANAVVWPAIHRLFPEAYFVHVQRDPRDVVCSIRAASRSWGSGWAPASPIAATRIWRRHVESALGIPEKTDRVRVVRYEALLHSGHSEIEALLRFVGVDSTAGMCERILEATSFGRMAVTFRGTPGFVRKGRSGNWRTELSLTQLRVVEYLAGDLMDRLGYERALTPPLGRPPSVALVDAIDGVWNAARESGARLRRRLAGVGEPSLRPPR